jgi:hypothetical protein
MLLHVSNGAYIDGVIVAKRFIAHVEILFAAVDELAVYIKSHGVKGSFFLKLCFAIMFSG